MDKPSTSHDEANGDGQTVPVRDKRKLNENPGEGQAAPKEAPVAAENGQSELETVRAEAKSHLDDLQRLKAEFDNYRKRVLKEQTILAEAGSLTMIAKLLGVLDNFELAVAAAEETHDFEKMLRGVEMVYGEMKEVLRAEGLTPVKAKDQPFDPNLHEAALEIPGDDSGTMVVAEVLRPGYMFKDRVLRPAMVKVTQRSP